MAETIGKRLREARESKGLSIQDVAYETRMHPTSVAALEQDDYSVFANTTYARSFLSIYCRFLEIEASDALEQFAGGRNVAWNSGTGLTVLQTMSDDGPPRERLFSSRQEAPAAAAARRPSSAPGFPVGMGIIVLALLIALPILYYVGMNAETPEEAQAKLFDLTKGISGAGSETQGQAPLSPEAAATVSAPSPALPTSTVAAPPPQTSLAQATTGRPEVPAAGTPARAIPAVSPPASDSPLLSPPAPQIQAVPAAATPAPVPVQTPPGGQVLRASPIIAVPVDPNAPPENTDVEEAPLPAVPPKKGSSPSAQTPPAAVPVPAPEPEGSRSAGPAAAATTANATPSPTVRAVDRPRNRGRNPGTNASASGTPNFVDPNHRFPRNQ